MQIIAIINIIYQRLHAILQSINYENDTFFGSFPIQEALYLVRDAEPLEMPRRPNWEQSWSKEKLDAHENKYFREYTQQVI